MPERHETPFQLRHANFYRQIRHLWATLRQLLPSESVFFDSLREIPPKPGLGRPDSGRRDLMFVCIKFTSLRLHRTGQLGASLTSLSLLGSKFELL